MTSNLLPSPCPVKLIFSPAMTRAMIPATFGEGIFSPRQPKPAPERIVWASAAEYRRHVEETTYSAAEWRAMQEEARAASLDRYHREASAEAQELAELGVSPAQAEVLALSAEDIRGIFAANGLGDDAPTTEPEPRRVNIRHEPYTIEAIAPQSAEVLAQCRITKIGGHGSWYDLARHADGRLTCDCPDFAMRHEGHGTRCKHLVAAVASGYLDAPAPRPRRKLGPTLHQLARQRRREAARS